MKEKVSDLGTKLKAFFSGMEKKTRTLLVVALTAIVVGAVAIAFVLNNGPYAVLFTGLTGEEARAIMSYLDESGMTDYRLQGSDTILVPSAQEDQWKAKLLLEGYPKSGFAYETYRSALGTMSTESDRNMAYLQDLQDRMAGVIRCLDGVKDAVVTIAPGEDRRYILDDSNMTATKAAVIVTMQSGGKLTAQQATAIRNLVARAVQGLEIDNVGISDTQGNTYNGGDLASGMSDASYLKLQLEEQVNNSVRTQVMEVLAPLYGEENVRVGVNSTVDISRTVGESTTYTEPPWSTNGEGIIGSKVYDQEVIRGGDGTVGGVVGTQSNSDINTYVDTNTQVDGDETYLRNSGETQYVIDSNREQVERVAGTVSNLMVSVSINSEVAGGANKDSLTTHVARAAGITPDFEGEKISILVAPFYVAPVNHPIIDPGDTLPDWVIYAAIGGAVLFVVLLLLIILLSRRRRKKKARELGSLLDSMPTYVTAEPEPVGADIMNIQTEKSMELRKNIRQFAEENPEIAAQMIKTWLRGGEEKNG